MAVRRASCSFLDRDHFFASVRQEGVLVVQRLTGQRWFQERKSERPDWHIKEVKAWWKENRQRFLEEHRSPVKEKR